MTALLATLTAIFSSTLGQAGAVALGGMLSAWLLGRFSGSAAYKTLRDKSGRQAYRVGVLVSKIGNTRLGAIWIPLEDLSSDFGAFWVEQFFVGVVLLGVEAKLDDLVVDINVCVRTE